MYCPKCGNQIVGEANFCPNCKENLKIANNTKNISCKNYNQFLKNLLIGIVLLIMIIVIGTVIIYFGMNHKKTNRPSSNKKSSTGETSSIVRDENSSIPKFIDGDFAGITVKSEEDVYEALEIIGEELKITNVKEELKITSKTTSENISYYNLNQIYKNLEVYNNNLILSVDQNGKILSLSGYYIPNINVNINGKKTQEELEKIVKDDLNKEKIEIIESKKYIYADNEYQNLIFVIKVSSQDDLNEYIVDADTGEIIYSSSLLENVKYDFTGKGVNNKTEQVTLDKEGEVYSLIDPVRNIEIRDGQLIGGNDAGVLISDILSVPMKGIIDGNHFKCFCEKDDNGISQEGITALKQYEDIYDYYYNVLGRKSYDNQGGKVVVNIGIKSKTLGKEGFDNAIWSPPTNSIYIGYYKPEVSYIVAKDVLAHEFTHGVISTTAKFSSSPRKQDQENNLPFETGALNEGISDILGSLIEGKNWTINEDIEIIRDLKNPNQYERPTTKNGKYYFPNYYVEKEGKTLEDFLASRNKKNIYYYDKGGVHHNSLVVGHAAYLMYENGAFKSKEEMAKVWYNSLFLMSKYSNFEDCALAVLKTAKNMGLSPQSISIIENAFTETKMLEDGMVEIQGVVFDEKMKLSDVQIEITNKKGDQILYEMRTNSQGNFSQKIATGVYNMKVSKDGYEEYSQLILVRGDMTFNIELGYLEENKETPGNESDEEMIKICQGNNCHKLTLYFLKSASSSLKETHKTYLVDDGYVMTTNILIGQVNKIFGDNIVKSDGESFEMTMGGFSVDFAWYYKDTDQKFNFDKPITEDTEIEMKLFDGMIDNDFIQDINEWINR